MPINFYIIITIQALMYIIFSFINKKRLTLRELLLSAGIGVTLGVPFDVLLGNFHLYTYIPSVDRELVQHTGLTISQLIINGLLSFGIAVATVKLFAITPINVPQKSYSFLLVVYGILLITSLPLIKLLQNGTIPLMFASGVFIVSLGELLLLFNKIQGPISELLISKKITPSFYMAAQCAFIGAVCELINFFFPFWVWLPNTHHNRFLVELLIVTLGYLALLHPMIIFWKLYQKKSIGLHP